MSCGNSRLAATLAGAAFFWSSGALAAPLLFPPGERAAVLLRESIVAPRIISYVGEVQSISFSSSRASATIVRIEHRAPDLTRRWYLAPSGVYGDYTVMRGPESFEFDTKRQRVVVSHDAAFDNQDVAAEHLGLTMSNYHAVLEGGESIAGRPTDSILLVNKYTGERAARLWLDRDTHLTLEKEEYHADGAVASQTRFEAIRYTSALPDALFSTDVPAGYEHVAGRDVGLPSSDLAKVLRGAGFKPESPRYLPQGFTLGGGEVSVVNGVKTLHLIYTDGLRSISLFENATGAAADFGSMHPKAFRFENHDAQYVEDGTTTLLTWKESNLHFALVGDLLRNELVDIAKSVVP